MSRARARYTVYIMTAGDGSTIYVGVTSDLAQRLSGHDAQQPWYADVETVRCEHFADKRTALDREAWLIKALRPPYGNGSAPYSKPTHGQACTYWRWCGALATTDRFGGVVCDYHANGGRSRHPDGPPPVPVLDEAVGA